MGQRGYVPVLVDEMELRRNLGLRDIKLVELIHRGEVLRPLPIWEQKLVDIEWHQWLYM